jgi:hypothetical protein
MKTSNFIVRIPEPCHEDWNSMQPDVKGKFCNSCSKSVFDFSNKTDAEIRDILTEYKDQKVCGHFKKTQINRTLNMSINLRDLPKNISMTKAFAIALFLVFGTFLFSCTDHHGQKVNEIEVINSEKEGMILGDLSFAPRPPIDFIIGQNEMISGDTMLYMDTLETISYTETHIDGGISIEEVPYLDSIVMDTVNLEEIIIAEDGLPLIENYMTSGSMMTGAISIVEYSVDSVSTYQNSKDSIFVEESRHMNNQDIATSKKGLTIYPNPSNGEFTFKYDALKRADVNIDIYDLKGVLVRTIVNIPNQYEGQYQIPVNLNELSNGIYLVNLIHNGKKTTKRLVIER